MRIRIQRCWKKPAQCNACGHRFEINEKYESCYNGKTKYCMNCANRDVLVFPLRRLGEHKI